MVAWPFFFSSNAFPLLFFVIVENTDGVRGIFMAEEPKQGKQRQMTWVTPLLSLLTWHLENNNSHTKQMEPRWEGWKGKWLNWYCWTHTWCAGRRLMRFTPYLSKVSSWWLGLERHSLAHVDPFCDPALITQHVAAPVEAAIAALTSCMPEDVVSAATAQRVACVHPWTTLVADATVSARRVHRCIALTEVRGFLKVNQLPGEASPPWPAMLRPSCPCCYTWVEYTAVLVLGVDEDGRLELLSQQGAHQPEFRRHIPAGLELAASRGAMTFALPFHVVCHYLLKKRHLHQYWAIVSI